MAGFYLLRPVPPPTPAECYRDLKAPRQVRRFTEQALSQPTEEFVRSHGLRLVVSAVAELESGNLDAACEQGERAVEVAGRISSARTTEYVKDLLRLEPVARGGGPALGSVLARELPDPVTSAAAASATTRGAAQKPIPCPIFQPPVPIAAMVRDSSRSPPSPVSMLIVPPTW
ncbi:hypothetical protein STENM327S_00213 [Streptomyces tendae]